MRITVSTIGVPMDLGQSRRGVDMGPSAVRYAGLGERLRGLGLVVRDGGNLDIAERDTLPSGGGMAYLPAVVSACEAVYREGVAALEAGELPIFLGGDHSIAVGTVTAATHRGPAGLLWIDAHGDFNTPETSPSGNLHGMPLAALTGRGVPELTELVRPGKKIDPRDVMLIGLRDLDLPERAMLKESGAGVYTMREIDERGIGPVAHEAVKRLAHLPRVHVSLDMDVLDPREAPGVGTPVAGGLSYREAHVLMEIIAESSTVASLDVVEINPILDDRNRTAELAVELILSVLGKTIL
jgi:arginase